MVSFDVVPFFTKVSVDLALQVAKRRLFSDCTLEFQTALAVDELLSVLKFCLGATYLGFRGCFFKQTYGTAMGSQCL